MRHPCLDSYREEFFQKLTKSEILQETEKFPETPLRNLKTVFFPDTLNPEFSQYLKNQNSPINLTVIFAKKDRKTPKPEKPQTGKTPNQKTPKPEKPQTGKPKNQKT